MTSFCPHTKFAGSKLKLRRDIHVFVKNPNYVYAFVTRNSVIDYVADHREFSVVRSNVVASASEVWVVCQLIERIVELLQVLVALFSSPPLLSENSNSRQIIFGSGFKLEGGHQ